MIAATRVQPECTDVVTTWHHSPPSQKKQVEDKYIFVFLEHLIWREEKTRRKARNAGVDASYIQRATSQSAAEGDVRTGHAVTDQQGAKQCNTSQGPDHTSPNPMADRAM